MTVITVSRMYGSGGDEIVDRVCQMTGYQRFDKDLVAMVAIEAGLTEQDIADFSEDDYKDKGFMDRLLGRSRPLGAVKVWREHMDGSRFPVSVPVDEGEALLMVQKVILAASRLGDWVIVGRGGQVVLKDAEDALHLRIEAPMDYRLQRVMTDQSLDQRQAQALINEKDSTSAAYLRRFYNVDWDDPSLYHFVINTARMDEDLAARSIAALASCRKPVEA